MDGRIEGKKIGKQEKIQGIWGLGWKVLTLNRLSGYFLALYKY